MIYRIRDTTTAWQIAQIEQGIPLAWAIRTVIFAYVKGRGPDGLYIETPYPLSDEFMEKWKNYLDVIA